MRELYGSNGKTLEKRAQEFIISFCIENPSFPADFITNFSDYADALTHVCTEDQFKKNSALAYLLAIPENNAVITELTKTHKDAFFACCKKLQLPRILTNLQKNFLFNPLKKLLALDYTIFRPTVLSLLEKEWLGVLEDQSISLLRQPQHISRAYLILIAFALYITYKCHTKSESMADAIFIDTVMILSISLDFFFLGGNGIEMLAHPIKIPALSFEALLNKNPTAAVHMMTTYLYNLNDHSLPVGDYVFNAINTIISNKKTAALLLTPIKDTTFLPLCDILKAQAIAKEPNNTIKITPDFLVAIKEYIASKPCPDVFFLEKAGPCFYWLLYPNNHTLLNELLDDPHTYKHIVTHIMSSPLSLTLIAQDIKENKINGPELCSFLKKPHDSLLTLMLHLKIQQSSEYSALSSHIGTIINYATSANTTFIFDGSYQSFIWRFESNDHSQQFLYCLQYLIEDLLTETVEISAESPNTIAIKIISNDNTLLPKQLPPLENEQPSHFDKANNRALLTIKAQQLTPVLNNIIDELSDEKTDAYLYHFMRERFGIDKKHFNSLQADLVFIIDQKYEPEKLRDDADVFSQFADDSTESKKEVVLIARNFKARLEAFIDATDHLRKLLTEFNASQQKLSDKKADLLIQLNTAKDYLITNQKNLTLDPTKVAAIEELLAQNPALHFNEELLKNLVHLNFIIAFKLVLEKINRLERKSIPQNYTFIKEISEKITGDKFYKSVNPKIKTKTRASPIAVSIQAPLKEDIPDHIANDAEKNKWLEVLTRSNLLDSEKNKIEAILVVYFETLNEQDAKAWTKPTVAIVTPLRAPAKEADHRSYPIISASRLTLEEHHTLHIDPQIITDNKPYFTFLYGNLMAALSSLSNKPSTLTPAHRLFTIVNFSGFLLALLSLLGEKQLVDNDKHLNGLKQLKSRASHLCHVDIIELIEAIILDKPDTNKLFEEKLLTFWTALLTAWPANENSSYLVLEDVNRPQYSRKPDSLSYALDPARVSVKQFLLANRITPEALHTATTSIELTPVEIAQLRQSITQIKNGMTVALAPFLMAGQENKHLGIFLTLGVFLRDVARAETYLNSLPAAEQIPTINPHHSVTDFVKLFRHPKKPIQESDITEKMQECWLK